MKMIDILEKDKNTIITGISAAGTAEKAVRILEKECDKLLLTYNEKCGSDAARDSAAHLMQAVRLCIPFIDSVGSTKVWEHGSGGDDSPKISIKVILLVIVGIALFAFGLIPLVSICLSKVDPASRNDILTRCVSVLLGAAVLFASGSMSGKPKGNGKREFNVEIRPDADRIYRYFRTVILSVDQSLEEVRTAELQSIRDKAGTIDGRPATSPELDLFADLLAASYSGDADYALEKIDDIKYFLHRQQIEVVDYSKETANYFDLMPGTNGGTIRPALIADGALLKKGLASSGRQVSSH